MSALKERIMQVMKDTMRQRDKERLAVIRLIQADLKRVEVDERVELDDDRILVILDKMLKQRRDSIAQFESAGRQELADKEAYEISVIQEFLPQQLSEEELTALIDEVIAASGAESVRDMGKVMGALKPKIQGRADVGQASQLVKARLA